jgi:hypothetical protein
MLCTLTARRLPRGGFDDFRQAFEDATASFPDDAMKRWTRVFVCRDVTDPDVVLTFGLFDGTLDELREIQARYDDDGRVASLAPHVDSVLLDGSYEVVEELTA